MEHLITDRGKFSQMGFYIEDKTKFFLKNITLFFGEKPTYKLKSKGFISRLSAAKPRGLFIYVPGRERIQPEVNLKLFLNFVSCSSVDFASAENYS